MEKVEFAVRLRELIDEFSLSQTDVVNRIQISKASISQYLSGIRYPKIDVIDKLSQAYGVQQAWLLGYDVPMKKPKQDQFSLDNAHLVAKIRNDSELTERLTKYFEADEDTKKRTIQAMDLILMK